MTISFSWNSTLKKRSFIVLDWAYTNYNQYIKLTQQDIYFVKDQKENELYKTLEEAQTTRCKFRQHSQGRGNNRKEKWTEDRIKIQWLLDENWLKIYNFIEVNS